MYTDNLENGKMSPLNTPSPIPLIGMTLEKLAEVAAEARMPKFAARQMAQWLYDKRVLSIDEMTNLSKKSRELLSRKYIVGREEPLMATKSVDGTVKYLFRGAGGREVESVYIPDGDRATLCVSSQAGCKMNCYFCMTGKQGFHGNLTAGQIINQVLSVPDSRSLTNIVYMGMGEPMDNIDAVIDSIRVMTEPWGLAWSPKRITVSSIGRIRELRRLLDTTNVNVAISVHSPFASERLGLMPVEKAFPVAEVMSMLREYDFSHQRRLSVEYIMWKGVNDDMHHADALARLIRGMHCRVNLIRFHAIPGVELQPCSERTMTAFRDCLNQLGITATIRASRGEDIMAACGMLSGQQKDVCRPAE